MADKGIPGAGWNPWHGCTKISPGCKHCYVYRQDEMRGSPAASGQCRKTGSFGLPMKRNREGDYKIPPGSMVYTCFTSDFLLEEADPWRGECWEMMRRRSDCWFCFFTKRIQRLEACLPADWGEGYDNVLIGCTVEDQTRAEERLPIFKALPIRHRSIIAAPLLGPLELSPYLDEDIEEVSVGGESGPEARVCDYGWIMDIRRQCVAADVPFLFHQTGARFCKDGRLYYVRRRFQHSQARRAGINYRIAPNGLPDTALPLMQGRREAAFPVQEMLEL